MLYKSVHRQVFPSIAQFQYEKEFECWCLTPLSAISWRPALVVEEAGIPGENHRLSIKSMPKLRTYTTMNTIYSVQPYLKTNISRQERSVSAHLRCGVFPLHIETGRYRGTPV
jgi:hypothetical protein